MKARFGDEEAVRNGAPHSGAAFGFVKIGHPPPHLYAVGAWGGRVAEY